MTFKIYKITNKINGLVYIGQTKSSLQRRFNNHCSRHSFCVKLKRAITKYGRQNFNIELLESHADSVMADLHEMLLIAMWNTTTNGYNIHPGGSGYTPNKGKRKVPTISAFKGRTHTAEARVKMRAARLGKSPSNKGTKNMVSDATRLAMSVAKLGKSWTEIRRKAG